jgi:hypothetical protein
MVKQDSGIELKSKAHYKTFGKFMINMDLLHANELLVKYVSYAPVYKIKRTQISTYFTDFLSDLLDNGTINVDLYKKLTFKDNRIFENLIIRAKLANQLGYHKIEQKFDEEQLKTRFEIIRGEIVAGHSNAELIEELIFVIKELFKIGKISDNDKNDLLKELKGL